LDVGRGHVGQRLGTVPALGAPAVARDVGEEPDEPRLQPPAGVEARRTLDRQQERLLQGVLGGGGLAAQVQLDRQQPRRHFVEHLSSAASSPRLR